MSKLIFNKNSLKGNARREQLNNQEHLVIPVIAMREGVMNDMFYSKEQIQANSQTWAGVPVPVGHPKKDGKHVSANSPDIEANSNIGTVYNPKYEDGELKVEFWINVDKATELGHSELITRIEAGDTIEVSTGLFSEPLDQAGMFNNTSYSKVAQDIRPDHLAILPDEVGACSVANGCGAGAFIANEEEPCCGGCKEGKYCEGEKKVDKLDVIFNSLKKLLFQQDDEFVELVDTKKTTGVVANKTKEMDKTKLIEKIVANTASTFTKEALEALEVNHLELIESNLVEQKVEKEVSTNSDKVTLDADQMVQFQAFIANSDKEKAELTEKVQKGYGLSDDQVKTLDVNTLKTFASKLEKSNSADFSGQGGGTEIETNTDEQSGFDCQSIVVD